MTSPVSPSAAGTKRPHQPQQHRSAIDAKGEVDSEPASNAPVPSNIVTSAFRNVSACNRCRLRKNKCDQRLPACSACEKASTRCVGFDPITKKEIPRSYVYFLEARLSYLETLLLENNVAFDAADAFEGGLVPERDSLPSQNGLVRSRTELGVSQLGSPPQPRNDGAAEVYEDEKMNKIVSDIGMVSVHGASERRFLGSTSGISFARVVLAAIQSSVPTTGGEKHGRKTGRLPPSRTTHGGSMRESYFGLSNRPSMKEAPFPEKELGSKLVSLYFEHANPQIPVLHRVEFMDLFERVYSAGQVGCNPRELYLVNIVFAIGAGVIFGSSEVEATQDEDVEIPAKRARRSGLQAQPEEYHASAIVHLNAFFTSSVAGEGSERTGGDLEDLQAILLLAGFALLRPVAPGLWYIVGVAMRLAVDLGLHFEDGLDLDGSTSQPSAGVIHKSRRRLNPQERGRREWVRDMRRRLWWCTYCFDRLVSTCVGRPFGITDSVITTEFPSLLDDTYISRDGFTQTFSSDHTTYKHVAHHYLKLRLLQSEILQVLQHQQAQQARFQGALQDNRFVHKDNPSPFLVKHRDFRSWRSDLDQRLWEWKEAAPTKAQTGVAFSPQFLELNYWQAVIMLYRNSLSVPEPLAGETGPTEEVSTPTSPLVEDKEDQDLVFLKCAEAGQKTLKLYRQLHRKRLVNYTYLATHHLFMAGISFLYAVWHSPVVRINLTLDDFDFTVLAATSVLGDLMEKCPPAKACRDAFERMSKATVQMCMNTPGFRLGQTSELGSDPNPVPPLGAEVMVVDPPSSSHSRRPRLRTQPNKRPPPQFDMNLSELFPDDIDSNRRPSIVLGQHSSEVESLLQPQQQQRYQYAPQNYQNHPSRLPVADIIDLMQNTDSYMASSSFSAQHQSHVSPTSMRSQFPTNNHEAPSYFNINQNSYNPDFMSNAPGMEFLNDLTSATRMNNRGLPGSGSSIPNTQIQFQSSSPLGSINSHVSNLGFDFDSLANSPTGMQWDNLNHTPGTIASAAAPVFNFGVGMGLDFNPQASWTEPQQSFDLGGFFFGGGNVNNDITDIANASDNTVDNNNNYNKTNDTVT